MERFTALVFDNNIGLRRGTRKSFKVGKSSERCEAIIDGKVFVYRSFGPDSGILKCGTQYVHVDAVNADGLR